MSFCFYFIISLPFSIYACSFALFHQSIQRHPDTQRPFICKYTSSLMHCESNFTVGFCYMQCIVFACVLCSMLYRFSCAVVERLIWIVLNKDLLFYWIDRMRLFCWLFSHLFLLLFVHSFSVKCLLLYRHTI